MTYIPSRLLGTLIVSFIVSVLFVAYYDMKYEYSKKETSVIFAKVLGVSIIVNILYLIWTA